MVDDERNGVCMKKNPQNVAAIDSELRLVSLFTSAHIVLERLLRPLNEYRCWPDQDHHLFWDFGGEADLRSYHSEGLYLTSKPHQTDLSDLFKLLP